MTGTSYQTIDIPTTHLWNIPEEEPAAARPAAGKLTILASSMFVGFLFVIAGVATGGGQSQDVIPVVPLMGTTAVRDCTFKECFASACNHESAPFTCLFHNGGPHGGCSAIPWVTGTCSVQCNLEVCDLLDIPDSTASCEDVQCDPDWCKGGQVCGPDVPYQCTSGSARFGCSDDALHWTLRTAPNMCGECCDISTC